MLSNLVLPVCFHSMQSTNPPKIQLDMDCNKVNLYRRHLATALLGRATWSTLLTINDITIPAEFILKFAIRECKNYTSWRISKDKWLVVRSVEREVHSLVPHFHGVHTITLHAVEDHGCLTCDYNYFECNGMLSQHLVNVKTYFAAKSVITHHDISVRWWKAYLYVAMKNRHDCSSTEREIKLELDLIQGNECKGPTFSENLMTTLFLHFVGFISLGRIPMINFGMPQNAA